MKVLYKCCECKGEIIIELIREPLCIETLASYIGYAICDKCTGNHKTTRELDVEFWNENKQIRFKPPEKPGQLSKEAWSELCKNTL